MDSYLRNTSKHLASLERDVVFSTLEPENFLGEPDYNPENIQAMRDMTPGERENIIKNYLGERTSDELAFYRECYALFCSELLHPRNGGRVTTALGRLSEDPCLAGIDLLFSRRFQIACVAARQKLQTPDEYLRENGWGRVYTKIGAPEHSHSGFSGPRVGRKCGVSVIR